MDLTSSFSLLVAFPSFEFISLEYSLRDPGSCPSLGLEKCSTLLSQALQGSSGQGVAQDDFAGGKEHQEDPWQS